MNKKRYRCTGCSYWTDDPSSLRKVPSVNRYLCPKCGQGLRAVPAPGYDLNQVVDMNWIDRTRYLIAKNKEKEK